MTPNPFRNALRCYKCGKNGHIARRCIEEKPPKKCYYCTKDHHYNLCESSAVCNKCGESDHIEYVNFSLFRSAMYKRQFNAVNAINMDIIKRIVDSFNSAERKTSILEKRFLTLTSIKLRKVMYKN